MAEAKAKKTKKRHLMACCIALAILAILGALALAFYLRYRPRPPRVIATPVDLSIDQFELLPHPTLKVSVGVHVVVNNPSNSPYRYGAAVSPVTYHGEPVGETLVPAGEIGGKSTRKVEPATAVDGVKVAESPHFAADVVAGVLPFVAVVKVVGKALVLRAFEVPVTVEVVCFVRMYVFHGESSSWCVSTVRTGGTAAGSGEGSLPPPSSPGAAVASGYPEGYAYEHD
ncbi:hypothetical protein EJB05_12198, partial [Eragrostis curvula]